MSEVDPREEQAQRRVGTSVLGRYRLEEIIGSGGLGVVYKATDTTSGATVAVKIMREEVMRVRTAAARFLREARIAQTLAHPAIPHGRDAGLDETGTPLIVMDFIAGENLKTILGRTGPLSIRDVLALGARVAGALDAAHRRGIIHRDIKPENIMLLQGQGIPEGIVIVDFGLAFCLDESRLSVTNSLVGSVEYMSPEQVRGEVVSFASDIYELGATLVHLLTGKTLYSGTYIEQLTGHAKSPVPSIRTRRPEVPLIVEHYLNSMLDKEPSRRPASAHEVETALRELAAWNQGGTTSPSTPPPPLNAFTYDDDGREGEGENGLFEQLHTYSSQLHHVTRAAAAAQAKMVQEIVEIHTRQMERAMLANQRAEAEKLGDAAALADIDTKVAALGDAAKEKARETTLENALAKIQGRARENQDEILQRIQELQTEIRAMQR